MDKHPAEKAQADLERAARAFTHYLELRKVGVATVVPAIIETSAYLALKDAMNRVEWLASASAVDETAKIDTTLTEGMRTLQAEGLQLHDTVPCDLIAQALVTRHLDAVA